ncbi:hypothetical protein AGDE_14367 [Angomonas deanei]|uniref:Uncharacterized protein n=1 Tax=Angomonas deanei TaxID=59799 RepID=A0A7G2CJ33_9TRYP|nr:hypothetical protein AGDE_14367 [Angomonas deanei]CAD2219858.1 hypothetical protein, conserved [Angomonas deanei]|eukprot:EPY20919.1 hypothetical protein AGDE_14367 [Angomonas deanei]
MEKGIVVGASWSPKSASAGVEFAAAPSRWAAPVRGPGCRGVARAPPCAVGLSSAVYFLRVGARLSRPFSPLDWWAVGFVVLPGWLPSEAGGWSGFLAFSQNSPFPRGRIRLYFDSFSRSNCLLRGGMDDGPARRPAGASLVVNLWGAFPSLFF